MREFLVTCLALALLLIPPGSAGSDIITVSSVSNHTAGEIFVINGTSTLPAGKILVIDIEPVRLHPAPSHEPPQNTTALNGQTITEKSSGDGTSRWSFAVDSGSLMPDDYSIRVTSFEPPVIEGSADFTLIARNGTLPGVYPEASERNRSPGQTLPQSMAASPLPVTVTAAALALLGACGREFRK